MQNHPPNPTPVEESILTTLRSFPRPVWILCAGIFLNKFGTFVVPFLTLYLTRRGFTTRDVGWALAAYGVGRLGATFLGGHLADTLGRRKTIVVSMTSAAAILLLLSQARSLPVIILLTGMASLTGELYLPACGALLTDLVPEHRRVTAYAAYRMAFNAGWAFGPAVGAFLAAHSFTWLFTGDALTSVLFGVIAWTWLPRGLRSSQREIGWSQAWGVIRQDRRIQQVALATVFIGLVIHQLVSTYGLHVTALGFSDATYGVLLSLNGLLVVVCELAITAWSRRFPSRRAMAVGYLLMGAGMIVNAAFHNLSALVIGMTVFTFGEMIYAPVAGAYVAGLAPTRLRGRYMGAWGFSNSVSLTLGPSLGLMVFDHSPTTLWLCCGALAALAAFTITRDTRTPEATVVTAVSARAQ
jgi:MFS family permease